MKLFRKIKLKTEEGFSRRILLCNHTICQYDSIKDDRQKRHMQFYYPSAKKIGSYSNNPNNKRVFYLKVNRNTNYAFLCLQNWINVVNELNADFYIICDKRELELKILERICFKNKNIKFLKSYNTKIKKYVKYMAVPGWRNAAKAHLTTFVHARENNINNFWNIDADDTMFMTTPNKVAEMISKAEAYATENNISAFSYDMWYSQEEAKHWSFGITYTNSNVDWFKLFDSENIEWTSKYNCQKPYNIDWFFTYLRNCRNIKNETFYLDRVKFIHWGNFNCCHPSAAISTWENGKINYPIFKYFYNDQKASKIIPQDCVKLDVGLNDDKEYLEFLVPLFLLMSDK